jgi:hypothetical protein
MEMRSYKLDDGTDISSDERWRDGEVMGRWAVFKFDR